MDSDDSSFISKQLPSARALRCLESHMKYEWAYYGSLESARSACREARRVLASRVAAESLSSAKRATYEKIVRELPTESTP